MARALLSTISAFSLAFFLFCLGLMPAHAEETFEQRIPRDLLERGDRFLTLTSENDLYGSGRDENYTNGLRATYMKVGQRPGAIGRLIDKYVPTFEINETTSTFYSIGQNLYTPDDITLRVPEPDDRPYAGFLYGSAGFSSVTNNHIDTVEATLGIVGPWALGEPTQETVHDLIDTDDPSGWDTQLENEPGLILSWERRWPEAWTAENRDYLLRLAPHIGASAGNVYTYAATGATVQFVPTKTRWQATPLRVRPAIPGSGVFAVPDDTVAWSLFGGVEGRAVARNIFLDGNTFEDSPNVSKKPFVIDANIGASIGFDRFRVSYTLNWRSKEFDGQDNSSLFGAISLGTRF